MKIYGVRDVSEVCQLQLRTNSRSSEAFLYAFIPVPDGSQLRDELWSINEVDDAQP